MARDIVSIEWLKKSISTDVQHSLMKFEIDMKPFIMLINPTFVKAIEGISEYEGEFSPSSEYIINFYLKSDYEEVSVKANTLIYKDENFKVVITNKDIKELFKSKSFKYFVTKETIKNGFGFVMMQKIQTKDTLYIWIPIKLEK